MNKYTAYIAAMDKNGGRSHTLDGNSLDSLKRRARAWSMQFAPLRLATICIFAEGEPHCKSANDGNKWTPWKNY